MADKQIWEFPTAEEAQDNDLLLIANNNETYNIKVSKLKESVSGATDAAQALATAQSAADAANAASNAAAAAAADAADAKSAARTANQNASDAKTAANSAIARADAAQTTANAAKASADSASGAVNTANEAKALAQTANTNANSAVTAASEARGVANNASDAAAAADTKATDAKALATNANTNANKAIADAASAKTQAQSAATAASSADTKATEAKSLAQTGNTAAASAVAAANEAKGIANAAHADAAAAADNASDALTAANAAVEDAGTALSTANSAYSRAGTAITTANSAASDASVARSDADTAKQKAEEAKGIAETAEENAGEALTTATTASENASAALSTAEAAASDASTALSTANTAASDASAAKTKADSASDKADAADASAQEALNNANLALANADSGASEAVGELAADLAALRKIVDTKVDDAYVQNGYLYMTADNEVVVGPLGPFSGGGGSGTAVAAINLTNVVKPTTVRNGSDAIFSFTATSTDDTNVSVTWYVDGIKKTEQNDRASGSTFSFNARDDLKPSDTSTVRAVITTESGATLARQWNIVSFAFELKWGSTIKPVTFYRNNINVYVVVEVSAQSRTENTVTLTIGSHSINKTVIGSKTVTFEVDKSLFTAGVNTLTAVMASGTDSTDTTAPISYKAIWATGVSQPVVVFANSTLDVSQYDIAPIEYFVYDPNNETASCTLTIGDEPARELSAGRTMQTLNYIPQSTGNVTVRLACSGRSATMTLHVTESQYDIGMITGDNLRYNIDPMGHSNTDADKTSFGGMTFSAGFDWTNGGFKADDDGAPAFVVKKGDRATLPRAIFSDDDGSGKTVDISFRIKNSDLYSAVAMQELNNGGGKGLILRANEGELRLNNASGQLFRYCEESRIDLSVNVEAVNDHRIMTVWLDGIPAQVHTYTANTLVQNENTLVIGSDHCDVWVYAIRVYNDSLNNRAMIQNYISLGSTTAEKIARCRGNDIFDDNENITPATLHEAQPDLTIVHISAPRMTTGKSDAVDATITIRDGAQLLTLDSGTKFKVQGTSSAAYGRSAYNLDLDFKNSGKTYKISNGAIPVNYVNIKVNVASSENANNVCAADMYNTYQPYLVPARATAGVRDTIEGKPCAVFFTNTSKNTIWIGSQQLRPGDTVLYAMGDLCNSKKNLAVFGQDGEGEHPAKGCIEVSGNDTPAQQFRATSTYNAAADDGKGEWQTVANGKTSKDFEWRAEPKSADKDTVIAAWNAAVAWAASTVGNATKFKNEVGDYFAIDSLLYHFLWVEFYSAFDNVSKNTFYSYEWDADAEKYLWNICKNYDDDTILGCDNDGYPLADFGTDFGDRIGNRALFNADENPIWVNIKEAYQDELAAMYIALRGRGAWDAASIINKWDNYQNLRPRAAMAEDAYNKYILPYKTTGVTVGAETESYNAIYLPRLQGSKTYQRRQFITYQAKYMDGKYGYVSTTDAMSFRANAPGGTKKNLTVRAYAKTYVTLVVDNGTKVSRKIETGGSAVFPEMRVSNNATIYATPESLITSITPINEINLSTFSAAGASKLQDASLGSETVTNTEWYASTILEIPSAVLKNLSLRNISTYAQKIDMSANVELESVDTRGTKAGAITLPTYAPLKTVHLNACSAITAINLHEVTDFSVASGDNLTDIRIEDCNSVVNAAVNTLLENAVAHGGNVTHRVRLIGANLSFDSSDTLYAIATNWKGFDALGAETDTPVITGTCYIGNASASEQTVFANVFPDLNITINRIVHEYTVTFKNYDGTVIDEQHVKQYGSAVDPREKGLSAPVKPASIEYDYTFTGWDKSFSNIMNDLEVTAQYTESDRYYTVTYMNGSVTVETDRVIVHGSSTYDGEPLKSASGVWIGWDAETNDVVSDMTVRARFLAPTTVPSKRTGHGYLYSDDPLDDSAYSLQEFYSIVSSGNGKAYFAIGDKVKITLGSNNICTDTDIELQVVGFEHYRLTGLNDFAGVVFHMVGVMDAPKAHSISNNNNTDLWMMSNIRSYLNGSLFGVLPVWWQGMIKPVEVLSSVGAGNTTRFNTTDDRLFLLSVAEVGLNPTTEPYPGEVDADAKQMTFEYYIDNYSRTKRDKSAIRPWWTRSPSGTTQAMGVAESGKEYRTVTNDLPRPNANLYISFAFCV